MVRYKMVNDTRIQLTAEEEKARDAEEKAWSDGQAGRDLVDLRNERNKLLGFMMGLLNLWKSRKNSL